jgi:hypothetical protein
MDPAEIYADVSDNPVKIYFEGSDIPQRFVSRGMAQ